MSLLSHRASHSCWADTLKEMVCVDSSGPMNILAERLLKGSHTNTLSVFVYIYQKPKKIKAWLLFFVCWAGDDERAEPHIKHVYFRQFLPVSPKVKTLFRFHVMVHSFANRKSSDRPVFLLPGAVWLGGSRLHVVRASQCEGPRRGGDDSVEEDKLVPGNKSQQVFIPILLFYMMTFGLCSVVKVLVENGTKEGHQMLMEARDTLLKVFTDRRYH